MNFLRRARGGANSEDSKTKDETAYERRRQQVRRAQRNHRERKQNYIKALEQEVVNLRRQNQQNIREYEDEIGLLHNLLLQHSIVLPPRQARIINAPDVDADVYYPSSYTVSKPPGLGQALHLHCPPGMGHDLSAGIAAQGLERSPKQPSSAGTPASSSVHPSLSPPANAGTTPPAASSSEPTLLLAAGLAPSALDKTHGISFVLALEHPCMQHPDATRLEFGPHSHMASHHLLSFAPHDVAGAASWEVPGADIERLLNLSTSFQLQDEITPVQAWYRLKMHPGFARISEAQLERLRALLECDVKCHGFGSVVDENIWALAVDEVLGAAE